jgi:hypothetical protein
MESWKPNEIIKRYCLRTAYGYWKNGNIKFDLFQYNAKAYKNNGMRAEVPIVLMYKNDTKGMQKLGEKQNRTLIMNPKRRHRYGFKKPICANNERSKNKIIRIKW